VSFIIAGLGNIGKQYEKTRHNAGFIAIDYIAQKLGTRIDRVKFNSTVAEVSLGGQRVLLMKPTTLMNNSGVAIGEAAAFYKVPPENVIVLHDEISFAPGLFRIRRKGSAGGHNGLKSIIAQLGSDAFPRVKIGVGQKPSPDYDLVNWVLGKFPKADLDLIGAKYPDIYSSVELMVMGKIDEAMNKYSK
jgi:PTH1 family peptidyl-tRNA hydrolase